MIRVLLVDDDPIVLVQLRNMIDWKKLNCELAAEATNGADAIDKVEQCDPQLIITDISMPGINGMELISYINRHPGKRKVIALSAYDDFDYVRKSLKSGAEDYLLKHQLTPQVLEQAILEAVSELEQPADEPSAFSLQKRQEHLLYTALHTGEIPADPEQLDELGLSWMNGPMILVLASLSEAQLEQSDITSVLMDETIRYYRDYSILTLEKGVYMLLFAVHDGVSETGRELTEQLQGNLLRIGDLHLIFVVSELLSDLSQLSRALMRCQSVVKDRKARGITSSIEYLAQEELSGMVRDAVRFIDSHYREKLSLKEIAEHLCVSASYLGRCFKKETGTTVVSYINQVRMKAAREMIDGGVLTLNEIAAEIGMPNYNYFYLLFKEVYGETPSEYMKKR